MTSSYDYNGKDMNYWANEWRDIGGPNVYPMNDKIPIKEIGAYGHLLNKPIQQELHNFWKKENYFENGIGIENGRCWHNKHKQDLWIHTIDIDTETGKNLILNLFGVSSLEELSKKGVVEHHKGSPSKFHLIIFTKGELPNLAANPSGVEIKGSGKLTTVTPTMHEDGTIREFIGDSLNSLGSPVPIPHIGFMKKISEALKPYGVDYLNGKGHTYKTNNAARILIETTDSVYEGARNPNLYAYACSRLTIHWNEKPIGEIKKMVVDTNQTRCVVPLCDPEVEQVWNSAFKYVSEEMEKKGSSNTEEKKSKAEKVGEHRPISIKKYTGNGRLPLHESIIIGLTPKFVTLDSEGNAIFKDKIDFGLETLVPGESIHTITPLPYFFDSEQEFKEYLELAKNEKLDSLFSKVEKVFKKYVDVEDYYYPILVGDIIWSHFQDKFAYTRYNFFDGDNGSGKNSALIVFKYLGYRVFYITSATAPNFYTQMGSIEEGQCTIAEDEAEDMAYDRDKNKVITTGYASGGSVPKTEMEGGRHQDNWLTYGQKWFAMEEIPDEKKMKAILDRSFVFHFIAGEVPYNIKDVIKSAGDPKYKPLFDELMHLRRLLFCYRLLHYNDVILDVELNVTNRSAEMTAPLIRLFANSPLALQRILDSLSKFMVERNEVKKDSFESKLYDAICDLGKDGEDEGHISSYISSEQEDLDFSNEQIRSKLITWVEAEAVPEESGVYYSPLVGRFTQTKITRTAKSRFKAKRISLVVDNKTVRGLRFTRKNLRRVKSNYSVPDKIEIKKSDS